MLLPLITQFSELTLKEMYGDYSEDFTRLGTIPLLLDGVFDHYVLTIFGAGPTQSARTQYGKRSCQFPPTSVTSVLPICLCHLFHFDLAG